METQVFDDGSTLTWDDSSGFIASTDATDTLINQPSASWTPQSVNQAASSWEDVLKFGLARIVDAKTRPVKPENTIPVQTRPGVISTPFFGGQGGDTWVWLLLAGLVAAVVFSGK